MKNEWYKHSDGFVIFVGVLIELPCFTALNTEASSKARKQSGCYVAVVKLSVGNPQASHDATKQQVLHVNARR